MKRLMDIAAGTRARGWRSATVVGLVGLSLAACASVKPQIAAIQPAPAPAVLQPLPAAPPPPQVKSKPPKPARIAASPWTRKKMAAVGKGARYKIGSPYRVAGVRYVPAEQPTYDEVGVASWYGDQFNGRRTANGERFSMYSASAAHTTLPMPSIVEVTNLENGRSIRVRLNDRGPFKGGRIIDLSRDAARELGYLSKGLARVRVRYLGPGRLDGSLEPLYMAQAPLAAKATVQLAANAPKDAPSAAKAVWRATPAKRDKGSFQVAYAMGPGDNGAGAKLAPLW